jgi:hypothetical protein
MRLPSARRLNIVTVRRPTARATSTSPEVTVPAAESSAAPIWRHLNPARDDREAQGYFGTTPCGINCNRLTGSRLAMICRFMVVPLFIYIYSIDSARFAIDRS